VSEAAHFPSGGSRIEGCGRKGATQTGKGKATESEVSRWIREEDRERESERKRERERERKLG
jgi:hypothetical protein